MTPERKAELEERARDYVSLFVYSGAELAARRTLAALLLQVEREVWRSVKNELEKDPLLKGFFARQFWDAHHVDLLWRHNGKDKQHQADWLKNLWYKCRSQGEGV